MTTLLIIAICFLVYKTLRNAKRLKEVNDSIYETTITIRRMQELNQKS